MSCGFINKQKLLQKFVYVRQVMTITDRRQSKQVSLQREKKSLWNDTGSFRRCCTQTSKCAFKNVFIRLDHCPIRFDSLFLTMVISQMFQEKVNTNISDQLAALHLRSDHRPSITKPLKVQILIALLCFKSYYAHLYIVYQVGFHSFFSHPSPLLLVLILNFNFSQS